MNQTVKLVLYIVLVGALVILGFGLVSALQTPPQPSVAPPASAAVSGTNVPATIAPVEPKDTNDTNQVTSTVTVSNEAAPPIPAAASDDDFTLRRPTRNLGRATAYGMAMFFVLIGLAVLAARDISHYSAGRVQDFIFNDNLKGVRDPEYDEAERIWAKGDHLDAVRLMRAYLEKHPREQYVALRIAEIYETDLRNYLAAALEYEDVLQKKLPAERWGWAAIHLANLYTGRLDKVEEATLLLHRIVDEYGHTAAAKKARERLGIPEPIPETSPALEAQVAQQAAANQPELEPDPEPEDADKPPSHNLPKGFRPK